MVLAMGGSKTILFNMSSCADCVNHGVVDTFMAALDRVAPLSDQLSGGRLIATDNLSRYGTRSRRDRRAFLVSLYQRLSALAGQKPSCFSPEPTVPPHSLRRIPWHIRQAMQMYESTPFEVREQLLALCAYQLEIKPTCTLCPRCAGICPTGALKFERLGTGKQVLFNARQCSGCGLCVAFCPSQAVALNAPLLCAL
jgi:ferredoxin